MAMLATALCFVVACVSAIRNPIISGWNPDPSIIRVGDTYYIATSSFEYFPGIPIYKSRDLANWGLFAHAQVSPSQLQLYGVPTDAGAWAPTLSYIHGTFYLTSMTRWVYDPVSRTWPRVFFQSSNDLMHWSGPVWCEPWGIDPSLFEDPITNKTYLNVVAPNNLKDKLWGIYQCEISLKTGNCIGSYRSLYNGTMPHDSSARDEGPKMLYKDGYYYLLIAEGGTDDLHRATIARSYSPEGPWTPAPGNPILFNGAYGYDNLTVQSTGHATLFDTPDGQWYAVFLARRKINGSSPLGRETFLTTVRWDEGWPILNGGQPITLSESFGDIPDQQTVPGPFIDGFCEEKLDLSWYQLRTPYIKNFGLNSSGHQGAANSCGIAFQPNVYTLSERDNPAAILRKQKSLNMTFSATLRPTSKSLGVFQTVGISSYLSEFQHEDIGIKGCSNSTGICVYLILIQNTTMSTKEIPLNRNNIPANLTLYIRAQPLVYTYGYSVDVNPTHWIGEIASSWLAFSPANYFVFTGASFALFASGGGQPWTTEGAEVGFQEVREEYYEENIPDYDIW